MVVVAIGNRELKTAVLQRGCIHGDRGVGYTSACRHRHAIQKVLRLILIPLCSELNTIVEESQVETNVISLSLLPRQTCISVIMNGRTIDGAIGKTIRHVLTVHHRLSSIVSHRSLITEFTITGAQFEHIDNVAVDGEELFLVETPT